MSFTSPAPSASTEMISIAIATRRSRSKTLERQRSKCLRKRRKNFREFPWGGCRADEAANDHTKFRALNADQRKSAASSPRPLRERGHSADFIYFISHCHRHQPTPVRRRRLRTGGEPDQRTHGSTATFGAGLEGPTTCSAAFHGPGCVQFHRETASAQPVRREDPSYWRPPPHHPSQSFHNFPPQSQWPFGPATHLRERSRRHQFHSVPHRCPGL